LYIRISRQHGRYGVGPVAHISGRDRWCMQPTDMRPSCPAGSLACRRPLPRQVMNLGSRMGWGGG